MSARPLSLLVRAAATLLLATPLLAAAVGIAPAASSPTSSTDLPEPSTWLLVGVALVAAVAIGRRRK